MLPLLLLLLSPSLSLPPPDHRQILTKEMMIDVRDEICSGERERGKTLSDRRSSGGFFPAIFPPIVVARFFEAAGRAFRKWRFLRKTR